MFDDMAERMDKVAKILAEMVFNAYKKERQEAAKNGVPAP
jgi:hypothetical protein